MSRPEANRRRGFTLIENLVAISILSVGLMSLAALMSKMSSTTVQSSYMSTAALLASEKLEDLNRYPATDPAIAVTSGSTAGSLTSDLTQSVTVGAVTETVDYFDQVQMSVGSGSIAETVSGKDSSGNPQYTTITNASDGTVNTVAASTAPASAPDTLTFKRRWVIEKNTPVSGVRRVTVLVTLTNPPGLPVSFQTSMVRP